MNVNRHQSKAVGIFRDPPLTWPDTCRDKRYALIIPWRTRLCDTWNDNDHILLSKYTILDYQMESKQIN